MDAKCGECGKKLPVNTALLRNVVGGSLITGAAFGWASYAFAGLLGFYGGAALIAIALLAGKGAVLASKDSAAVVKVGTKITDISNVAMQASLKSSIFKVSTIPQRSRIDLSDIGTTRRK